MAAQKYDWASAMLLNWFVFFPNILFWWVCGIIASAEEAYCIDYNDFLQFSNITLYLLAS